MKRLIYIAVTITITMFVLVSCVSKHKYYTVTRENEGLRSVNKQLESQVASQKDDIGMLNDSVSDLRNNIAGLNDMYQTTSGQLNMTKSQIAAQRARLKQLETFLSQQQQATEDLRKKIADALTNFNASELTVTMKDGRVYVSMQESLLFPSGSAVVNKRGKEALAKVAGVLNSNSDISIDVEGHTDDVPIHNKMYSDNWALSVARAVAITHVLIDEYGVSPLHITASGRSKFEPVASNSDASGRALNRRTEIILVPKYEQLMQILNGPITTAKQ
jgi:chemotaxis protein MotB